MTGEAAEAFAYHRGLAPVLWVFMVLCLIELAVVHLLVSLWNMWAALALSLVSLVGIAWLAAALRAMRHLPVLIDRERLVWRVGWLKRLEVPMAQVTGLREGWDAAFVKRKAVLNLALAAYPNVVVALDPPVVRGRRTIVALAHKLDDPAGFVSALRRAKEAG